MTPPPSPPRTGARTGAEALVLAAGVFAVYAYGACRTIYVGDSGELVAASYTLGVPHPTGYPLYVLLGKLFQLAVPVGSIAHRMSLFSAAAGAGAALLLYGLGRRLALGRLGAAVAALALAFAPSVWGEANVQRVYTLNALCLVASLVAATAWFQTRRDGPLLGACFLAGLGATNHTYMGLYGVGLGLFAVVEEPRLLRRPRLLAACVGVTLLGLVPYAYLPWASARDPRLDWGDPETLERFLAVVTRAGFWERAWLERPSDWLVIVADWALGIARELGWIGVPFLVVGVAAARSRGWPLLLLVLAALVNLVSMGLHGSRSDLFLWHRYYVPTYVVAALLAGLGVEVARARFGTRAAIAAVAVPVVLVATGWRTFDRSRYRIAEDYSRQLLASLPPGATLAASDDNILFVLIYLQLVEGARPDVDLILQGVGGADLPALKFDPDVDPLYFTHHPNWKHPMLEVLPVGLVFRTVRAGRPLPALRLPAAELAGESDPRVPQDYLTRNLVGEFHYMLGVTFEERDWARAEAELALAQRKAPENDVLFYNLGLIYERNGAVHESLAAFERSAAINPRHIASNKPVRPADRVAHARAEVARIDALEAELTRDPRLAGAAPGTAPHHRGMAALLAERGEALRARYHRLRASVAEEGA